MSTATASSTRKSDILNAARSITETLRAHAEYGETHGRLPDASIEALKASGMLSLWRPRSLGGLECDPVTYIEAVEEIAAADSAAGWLLHGTPASWLDIRTGSDELIREIVESAEVPVLAGTFNRPFQAVAVEGGYEVTGASPFGSACRFADWIGHLGIEGERMLFFAHPKGALKIREDWDSLGMRGTSSNTIEGAGVFVPEHRVIDFGNPGPNHPEFQGPLYRMSSMVIPSAISACMLGTLRGSLNSLKELAEAKTPFGSTNSLKHRSLAQHRYGEALALYRAARAYLHTTLGEAYAHVEAGGRLDLRGRSDLVLAYAFVQQRCLEAVRLVARAAGTTGVFKGHALERAVRDAEVMSHHVFGAEGRYATAAQAHWGLEVDLPMLNAE